MVAPRPGVRRSSNPAKPSADTIGLGFFLFCFFRLSIYFAKAAAWPPLRGKNLIQAGLQSPELQLGRPFAGEEISEGRAERGILGVFRLGTTPHVLPSLSWIRAQTNQQKHPNRRSPVVQLPPSKIDAPCSPPSQEGGIWQPSSRNSVQEVSRPR